MFHKIVKPEKRSQAKVATTEPNREVEAQDRDALLRFVERFALVLTDAGLPRMQARVFSYVLAEDAECYTAAELADGLGVSRAAISSATRALVRAGLLERSREPWARVDTYCVEDEDVWDTINRQRLPILDRYLEVLEDGVRLLGPETRGGKRVLETQAYLRFFASEAQRFGEEWRRRKPELMAEARRRAAAKRQPR